ncbi:MAG TPA: metallophosphoesterase family protein [Gemmatimonadaceae bacterium]|nr:metallophosphoesterase family protein [Gemmatimonadaceae bacterium]
MRYALLADVHANLPALQATLDDVGRRRPDAVHHLGDLVGYAPWPNETVALLLAGGITGVAGNYDSTVATAYEHCGCRYDDPRQQELAQVSYAWTRRHVTATTRSALAALPFRVDLRPSGGHAAGPTVTLLHGSDVLNTVYVHARRSDDFLAKMGASLGARPGDVVCVGHTHVAWHRVVGGVHFVNAGSVGRPKDGDWRACYALLTVDGQDVGVEFVRVAYDVETTARGIREHGLPEEFAEQLRTGGERPAGSVSR